jgi:hypothetical protein
VEAGRLQGVQEDFIAETGLDFRFMFAIYEGSSGNPATENDCESYAKTIGAEDFPVFADGNKALVGVTPMTQQAHPQMCALAPDLEILKCFTGHGGYEDALDEIRTHAGL